MKIIDYINSNGSVLNQQNIFTLQTYEQIIQYFTVLQATKYVNISYNQDTMHNSNIANTLLPITNRAILLTNLDFDFPPPKKPYEYDAYFNPSKLPDNYSNIPYFDKINTDILPVIEKNNIHIFAHSVSINHPNITMIPAGVFYKFNHFHMKTNSKDTLCYANFGLSCDRWFGNPRNEVVEFIKNKNFIKKENIDSARRDCLNETHFYEQISKSKFAICPRGCGIDTYRLWDCICLGCIPIVEKYGGYEQFEDLPILFIDSYKDYVLFDEHGLTKIYDEMMSRDYNYSKLTVDYWVENIRMS
jgi:hypothetical protein